MKWYQSLLIGIYGLLALYFLYYGILQTIVYILNKFAGHPDSPLLMIRQLVPGIFFMSLAISGWYLIKHTAYIRSGNMVLIIPAGLFILGSLLLLLFFASLGGKWN